MGIILFGVILLGMGLAIGMRCNQTFYKAAPCGMLIIVSLLYFGSFCINLEFLFWGITGLGVFCWGYVLLRYKKIPDLVDGSMLFFCIIVIYFAVILYGRRLNLPDEFSYWGTAAKNMYFTNHLPTNYDSIGNCRDYIPGCALLQYYVMRLNLHYSEGTLFQTIAVFIITMLLPFYNVISAVKSKKSNVLIGVIILIVPVIYNYAYTEIIIDTALGSIFGYIVITYLMGRRSLPGYFEKICAVLGSVVITTFKAPGIGFVLIICIVLLSLSIFDIFKRYVNYRGFIKEFFSIGAIFAASLLAKFFWYYYMKINQISVYATGGVTSDQLILSIKEGLNSEQWTKIRMIIKLFFYPAPSLNICSLSYVGWFILLAAIAILTLRYCNKQNMSETMIIQMGFGIGALMYLIYLIGLYIYAWSWYPNNGSFYKYYNTYLLGYLIILIYLLLSSRILLNFKHSVLLVVVILGIMLGRVYEVAQITIAAPFCNYISQRKREATDLPWLPMFVNEDVIGVLDGAESSDDDSLIFNYEFTPYHSIYYGSERLTDLSVEQLEDDIRLNGVSYIYINGLSDEEKLKYRRLFSEEGDIPAKSYFKVIYNNDEVQFKKIIMPV